MRTRISTFVAASLVLAAVPAFVAGCDGAPLFNSKPASASGGGSDGTILPPGLSIEIEYRRERGAGVDPGTAAFTAAVRGAAVRTGTLILPDGSLLPLDETGAVAQRGSEEAVLATFPNGAYTFQFTLEGDRVPRTVTVLVHGSFPDFPEVLEPAHGATGVPTDVRFLWAGPDVRYDVAATEVATGERVFIADGIEGLSAQGSTPLRPASHYVAEVVAETGPRGAMFAFASAALVWFTTGSE